MKLVLGQGRDNRGGAVTAPAGVRNGGRQLPGQHRTLGMASDFLKSSVALGLDLGKQG